MNWGGGGGRSPSLTSLFSSVKGCFLSAHSNLFNYFKSQFLVLKKSFTLVELSIVLLVLALLVSTLLVGRQIIDRAKVQQVISEIDYYTKNFQMFRDQYDFLPGALGVENCKKYPEFSLQKGDEPTQYPSQCDDPTSQKTLLSENSAYTSYKQANFSMVDMVVSGMVENRSPGDRRRKKFDIAEKQETTCIEMPAIRGGYYAGIKCNDNYYMGIIDATKMAQNIYYCKDEETFVLIACYNATFYSSVPCNTGFSNRMRSDRGAMVNNNCTSESGTINLYACGTQIFVDAKTTNYYPLSTWGLELYKDEMTTECETKTIPGEPRLGYLLKQDEIENQANKSSFDSKTWISYTGGKVDNLMIYGIGNNNVLSGAGENSVIVFFHFDADKNELTDDGAVSYALYDLIVKKLGEKKDGASIGNIIPFTKSSGQGFNFGYIMR